MLTTPRKHKASLLPPPVETDSDSTSVHGDTIDWQDDNNIELGPTPQKHGRIIGLFDTLEPIASVDSVSTQQQQQQRQATQQHQQKSSRKSVKSPLKTPSFLRKHVLPTNDSDASATPRLLFRALPKRGLSLLISELREIEDNEEDEGLSVLREQEAAAHSSHASGDNVGVVATKDDERQVNADGEGEGGGGEKDKVKWKKKGLKRAHRRVIMRPSAHPKSSKERKVPGVMDRDEEEEEDRSDEYINSEDEALDAQASLGDLANNVVPQSVLPAKATSGKRKAAVSQNFKSLKLRNTGAKGGSRFGRGKFGGGGKR